MSNTRIVKFGPVRTIGVGYVGKNDQNQIPRIWSEKLLPRASEVDKDEPCLAFGVCRCSPGAEPGAFEYLATLEASDTAKVPEGMVEYVVPAADYYVKRVSNLSQIGPAWEEASREVAQLEGWIPFCGPEGCDCATAASFEYYPQDFSPDGELFIYIPVRPA